ncbi:protein-disulfide isomerase [Paucimonas lemoignei]|uniref:Protein-disulfide isomerase n=1 Tax=Paucimonas lemoignei TaxID=29443 RepID=A0A4R3HNT4_PAULE|nr:thioredoxin domain-containing protein [Paucimonas lemoignei]TCS32592.1 protein-disulfide isomerase [Paucimonas lemoignei]
MSDLKVPVTSDDHVQGDPKAPVTLVEYGDYQCPYCGAAHVVVKLLQQHYGKDLRFVFRNFPLTQLHPEAAPAAETAEFAGAHGQYWEAHDALYENQTALDLNLYEALVKTLGLSAAELRQALAEDAYLPKIQADFDSGVRSGVAGTPTFFINGDLHQGSSDLGSLAAAIEAHRQNAGLHRSARRSML